MNEKVNWKSIVAGLIVFILGIGFILFDIFGDTQQQTFGLVSVAH